MSTEVEEKIRVLTEAYAAQLPIKIKEIASLWAAVKKNNDKEQLIILTRSAHTLCGTGGTYGYTLISDVARMLEQAFKRRQTEGHSAAINIEIDNLIQDLQQLVMQAPVNLIAPAFGQDVSLPDAVRSIYILITDNDLSFNQMQQFDYTVKTFSDLEYFCELVTTDRPDMVIIDVSYAEKIPFSTIKKFQEDLILIVYTSNQDELTDRLIAIRHGGQGFVVKPVEVNSLLQMVDNLFAAKRLQNERILIVDDSEFLADYYAAILEHAALICQKVIDAKMFLSTLQEFQPDLILMDVNMPYCSGTELAQIVHQQENLSGIPVIFLSTITEKSKQLEVLSYAGDEFLAKPVQPKYLLASIRHRLMRSRMVRSRMMRDSLTNLYNHTMIHHQLERELVIAGRYKRDVCVVLFDIDHFKRVNDTYGHQSGDKVLKELSLFLQKNLRKSDLVGRYGGEEFLVVLPDTQSAAAFKLIDDLRKKFSQRGHLLEGREVFVTISGGIAAYPGIEGSDNLIKAADDALYRAKESGRNQILLAQ